MTLHRPMRLLLLAAAVCAATLTPSIAYAQGDRYAVLVQGVSGDESFAAQHRKWLDSLAGVLRERFGFDQDKIFILAEKPKAGEQLGNAVNLKATLSQLAGKTKDTDQVFIVLIGHSGGDGPDAKFNLMGPDLTVIEWSAILSPIKGHMAFIDTTGGSFPYLKGLSAPGRVVITATASYAQRFDTVFPDAFIRALSTPAADADKNGRISVLEAFLYAQNLVKEHFAQSGYMQTENAVFNDTGDGSPQDKAVAGAAAGAVAGLTYLDVVAAPKSSDPAVQALLVKQQQLTQQVDDLRRRRPTMTPEDYAKAFEPLIVELALVSRDVRRKTGG